MKTIKKTVDYTNLVNRKSSMDERMKNGKSITKAIIMGGKSCCGGAYVESSNT